ncbi:MAG: phage tail protein [Oscillospiraceae bacterium]|nr:phage tail protein [Oscillospiraceae bacterium]
MANQHNGCNFSVNIAPVEIVGNFSAVSGLGAEIEYEEYHEGGNFTSPVYLPKGVRYDRIVLERGTVTLEPLTIWFTTVQAGMQLRYPMIITMHDEKHIPVKIWTVLDAMPVKVDYTPLDAMNSRVSVTTVEFVHGEIINIM